MIQTFPFHRGGGLPPRLLVVKRVQKVNSKTTLRESSTATIVLINESFTILHLNRKKAGIVEEEPRSPTQLLRPETFQRASFTFKCQFKPNLWFHASDMLVKIRFLLSATLLGRMK